jgi:branched-chain amino acid transport system ATP-binding protein
MGSGAVPLLEIRDLDAYYGGIQALRGVCMEIAEGELVALVGNNGAGKSTLLHAVSGIVAAARGVIRLAGVDLAGKPADQRVRMGVVQVPEARQVFEPLSVEDNLLLGAFTRRGPQIARDLERTYALFPILAERRRQAAGTLSGGQQQMLAIGRGLMADPKLLLLDEPSMGLAPNVADETFDKIKELKVSGVTILLVEQNASSALFVADRGYVLETGSVTLSGSGHSLLADEAVRKAYLGM